MTEPPLDETEQAHLDLHGPRILPPPTRPPDDVHQPVDTIKPQGEYL